MKYFCSALCRIRLTAAIAGRSRVRPCLGRRHTSGGGTCSTIPCPSCSRSRSWLGEGSGPSLGCVRSGTSCQRVPRHGGRSSSSSVAYSLAVVSPFGDASPSSDEPGKGDEVDQAPPQRLPALRPQRAADGPYTPHAAAPAQLEAASAT